ncbi:hypothetical protein Tco_1127832 [Tanacetum coccineum]
METKGNYLDSVIRGKPEEDSRICLSLTVDALEVDGAGQVIKMSYLISKVHFVDQDLGISKSPRKKKSTPQPMHSEERTADKEAPLSSDEQALHDELVSLMHQESLAKLHNDAQRTAFEKEKKRIAFEKGKECVDSTFTLSTANTPPQSTGNTPTDSDDDIPKDGVFSRNSFDAENTDTKEGEAADYNNMDPIIDVTSTPTLRIHKIHPQSQIIGKSTVGVQTRRKLKDITSNQHQALLSFIYKQNRTNHKDRSTAN